MTGPAGPDRHASGRGWIETILRYIPGFRGYLEKGYRRESDHLARKWMADRLTASKKGLDGYINDLVSDGKLDGLDQIERCRSKLDGLINSLLGAVRGYSGFFDFVQVDEALLDKVYAHDMAMIEDVEGLAKSIETLGTKPEEVVAVAKALRQHIDEVQKKFDIRGQLLEGIGPQ